MYKVNNKSLIGTILATLTVLTLTLIIGNSFVHAAQPTVNLGTATPFAILAGTPGITNTGPSVITGNVGLYPGPGSDIIGLLCSQVTGTIYARDATGNICFTVNDPLLLAAKNDLTAAYTDAANRTPVTIVPDELGGTTLTPGVYASTSTILQISAPNPLILDAQNDPSAVFIFEVAAEAPGLTVGPGSVVQLTGQAQACNVFWRVDTATIDTTAVFKGNILALNSITVANGANIEGSLLARNGQVTLINDTITVPVCTDTTSTTVVPGFPNTGSSSGSTTFWVFASAGMLALGLLFAYVARKKYLI